MLPGEHELPSSLVTRAATTATPVVENVPRPRPLTVLYLATRPDYQ
jgi:hypothetical protein